MHPLTHRLRDFIPVAPTHIDVPLRIDVLQLAFPRKMVIRSRAREFFAGHPNFHWFFRRYYDQLVIQGELLHFQSDIAAFLRSLVTLMDAQNLLSHEPSILSAYDTTLDVDLLFTQISISRMEFAFDLRMSQITAPDWLILKLSQRSHYSGDFVKGRHPSSLILYNLLRKYQEKKQPPSSFLDSLQRPYRLEFRLFGINCPFLNLGNLEGPVSEVTLRFSSLLSNLWWRMDFNRDFQLQSLEPEHPILDTITGYKFDDKTTLLVPTKQWKKTLYNQIMSRFQDIAAGLRILFGMS